jgi:hypothetical protein
MINFNAGRRKQKCPQISLNSNLHYLWKYFFVLCQVFCLDFVLDSDRIIKNKHDYDWLKFELKIDYD